MCIRDRNSELWIRKKTKDLEILVYLHRDHKIYFSPNPDQHKPFRLGKHDGDHRAYIKDWFTKKYDLTLSVRPPFEKTDSAVKYHAQMQKGVYEGFGEFTQPTQPRL